MQKSSLVQLIFGMYIFGYLPQIHLLYVLKVKKYSN